MRIGELATKTGVNLQTIRFYERRGLLRNPSRTPSGYRVYAREDFENLAFIKWCQRLGFKLKEIKQLLRLHTAIAKLPTDAARVKSTDLSSIVRMAEGKIADIEERVASLQIMKKQLFDAIKQLQREAGPACPASKPPNKHPRRRRASAR